MIIISTKNSLWVITVSTKTQSPSVITVSLRAKTVSYIHRVMVHCPVHVGPVPALSVLTLPTALSLLSMIALSLIVHDLPVCTDRLRDAWAWVQLNYPVYTRI